MKVRRVGKIQQHLSRNDTIRDQEFNEWADSVVLEEEGFVIADLDAVDQAIADLNKHRSKV
ncbi:hypothetical protein ACODYM_29080 [Burkholderia gladioli]|uniref:hypothetical protein n=1 Tax=Burkholderia gladioli TaxID=28095 RepID=UPI003B50494B